MTAQRLAELRALVEQATPAPWHDNTRGRVDSAKEVAVDPFDPGKGMRIRGICQCADDAGLFAVTPRDWHNAAFIAAARSAVPELLDEVERLRGIVADLANGPPPWSMHYEDVDDGDGYSDEMERADGPCSLCGARHGTPVREHMEACPYRRAVETVKP